MDGWMDGKMVEWMNEWVSWRNSIFVDTVIWIMWNSEMRGNNSMLLFSFRLLCVCKVHLTTFCRAEDLLNVVYKKAVIEQCIPKIDFNFCPSFPLKISIMYDLTTRLIWNIVLTEFFIIFFSNFYRFTAIESKWDPFVRLGMLSSLTAVCSYYFNFLVEVKRECWV